jgi:acyl transferase domain-containing protein
MNKIQLKSIIKEVIEESNISIENISYIETHGTGTKLGEYIVGVSDSFSPGSLL